MKSTLLDILACPTCIGPLEVKGQLTNGDLVDGSLHCRNCALHFVVQSGIGVFGIREADRGVKEQEMQGENEWVFAANDLQEHLDYAKVSREKTETAIKRIMARLNAEGRTGRPPRVLDIGAGWGAFQSWQFAAQGLEVVAAELVPEFLFTADRVVEDTFFERIVADCTVLPFKNESFDVILCKEFIHHMADPADVFAELWRVATAGALIVVEEPCTSILVDKYEHHQHDVAVEAGITHYYYSYGDYVKHLKDTAYVVEMSGQANRLNSAKRPLLAWTQRVIDRLSRMNRLTEGLMLKLSLSLLGGEISIIAAKKPNREGSPPMLNRHVIPISLRKLRSNSNQVRFYANELIPAVFEVFKAGRSN